MAMMTQAIVVLTDHIGDDTQGYTLTTPSAQLLTLARQLTSGDIVAVALNNAPDMDALSTYGATAVMVPSLGSYSPRVSAVVADALEACVTQVSPGLVLAVSNYRGKEVCARLATHIGSGAAVDINAVEVVDGTLHITRSALAGSWTTELRVTRGTPVLALRPSVIDEVPTDIPTTPQRVDVAVEFSAEAQAVTVKSSAQQTTNGRVSLTQARTVVVGGRGTDGDFSLVEELADILGGAVGATRVASDEGWVPRSMQIGQTGLSISPNVYVGLGVSGAIHHTVGMQSSEHIVAVCDDPDAPIFEIVDLGIVGDLFEVVPQAIEAIKEARG